MSEVSDIKELSKKVDSLNCRLDSMNKRFSMLYVGMIAIIACLLRLMLICLGGD
ncbi:MAG: hypothetical protein LBT66_01465 [Methanobrevibacter sp.]|jgi:hypothetical protein|nr:hypothetical protein [Candidatus Methanovirga meridionalis]